MAGHQHSPTRGAPRGATVVFTDGACSGNPGPGGWAWVSAAGGWASGFDADTTNQRMELTAVLRACEHHEGRLHVVSDSTYVVNCWRDRWWQGWLKRGWRNSRREPVANRDLWEQLVPHFRDRAELTLEWVKGHSGEHLNEVADRLAVGAVQRRSGASGKGEPPPEVLGSEDRAAPRGTASTGGNAPPRGNAHADGAPPVRSGEASEGPQRRSALRRSADPRVPEGHLLVVTGDRREDPSGHTAAELGRIFAGKATMHPELVVLTGLRPGAETEAAEAALGAGLPHVVVLPYPDPTAGWSDRDTAEFAARLGRARSVVTLEKKRPGDGAARRASLARRDGWLRSVADEAVVVTDGRDPELLELVARWDDALAEDVWHLEVPREARSQHN